MGKQKVLIVDDEKKICDIAEQFLVKKNYQVFCATTAEEALQLTAKELPELILLDIRLGQASGLDLLPKLKEIDKEAKIIMLTALDDAETIHKAKERGADGYILKPFDLSHLEPYTLCNISSVSRQKKDSSA